MNEQTLVEKKRNSPSRGLAERKNAPLYRRRKIQACSVVRSHQAIGGGLCEKVIRVHTLVLEKLHSAFMYCARSKAAGSPC